jgi:biopolymer transport protein ExbB
VEKRETSLVTESLSHFFAELGAEWILWLLLGLSLLSVTVMVERGLFLRRNRTDLDALTLSALKAYRTSGTEAVLEVLKNARGMAQVVLMATMEAHQQGVKSLDEIIRSTIAQERIRYDRFLAILGTIAANAPFLGLLGTVIGVLNAFSQLAGALEGTSQTELVMSSISEALVATAVGLAVAIPAVVAFNAFKRLTSVLATRVASSAQQLTAYLTSEAVTTSEEDA